MSSSSVSFPTRDEDVELLTKQLISDEKCRCISSIVGIEGTGKTTLARLIFSNKKVIDRFTCRIWVSVSSSSTDEQLMEEIEKEAATQIMGAQRDRWTTQDPTLALRALACTKYLIVVDAIQSSHFLNILTEAIHDMSTGCRFLLTTRNAKIVAPQPSTRTRSFVHRLHLLDDQNSWILFTTNLKVHVPSESKLTQIGKKIVAKCWGLPSQILKMSDLLSHKDPTEEEWSSVLALEQPDQGHNPWSKTLHTLNTNLRECLFYFEVFPAGFEVPARRILAQLVAEGVVHHREEDQETPEVVAERYLTELIDLGMLQIAKRKPNGKVKTYHFPNGMREALLLTKANESRIYQVRTSTLLKTVHPRILSITRVADRLDEKDIWHKHIHGQDYTSLRTYYLGVLSFLSFDGRPGNQPGQEVSDFLNLCISSNCLLLLRVLDLEGVYMPNLPTSFSRLLQLRYLGLRRTYLESLPFSLCCTMLQLQTLDLKHTNIHTLTNYIWNMQLRHLFLSETHPTRNTFPPEPLVTGIGNSLSDLQTLSGLSVDQETPLKGCLDKLINIRKLGIACQSKSLQQEAMESQLNAVADWIAKLEYLQSLKLKSRDEAGRAWNIRLKSLKNHINLTDLYLLGCLSGSSILSQFPPSLVELTLSHSKLEEDPMQILKDLPNLQSLSLLAESYVGKILVCNSESFPQLNVLKVWKLKQLEKWNIEVEALPSLRQLEIRSCPNMKKLPDGLRHVYSLLELKLANMPTEINTYKHNIPPKCKVHRTEINDSQ